MISQESNLGQRKSWLFYIGSEIFSKKEGDLFNKDGENGIKTISRWNKRKEELEP